MGAHVNYVYFPTSGIVSLIYDLEDGSSSEVALVGNEGMVGISIFMGGDSMAGTMKVQSKGGAYRLSRKGSFRRPGLCCPSVSNGTMNPLSATKMFDVRGEEILQVN